MLNVPSVHQGTVWMPVVRNEARVDLRAAWEGRARGSTKVRSYGSVAASKHSGSLTARS